MAKLPLLLALSLTAVPAGAAGMTPAGLREAGYFELLDYYDRAIAAKIPLFDAQVRAAADAASRKQLDPDSALLLVYAGLYIANTDYGADSGHISYKDLIAPGALASERTLKAELVARESLALGYFDKAASVLKNDKRVDGWRTGARIRLEAARDGKPSPAAVESLLSAAEAYPVFNLFSGLILSNEHSFSEQEDKRLFELVKLITSDKSPCNEPGARCGSSPLAPYADQGAAVLLGDAYLKQGAARLKQDAEDKEGFHDTGISLILYTSPYLKGRLKTMSWSQRDALGLRLEQARDFMRRRKPLPNIFSNPAARAAYQCAACHSGSR